MSEYKTPEEILNIHTNSIGIAYIHQALSAMKEYGNQRFIEGSDKALAIAADKFPPIRESLLSCKKHPDLIP